MNIWDIISVIGVLALVTGAVLLLRRSKKRGGCSCGCEGCSRSCTERKKS